MLQSPCSVPGCVKPAKTRGMCGMHVERIRHRGTTDDPVRQTIAERFWANANKTDDCWLWTGDMYDYGYGRFGISQQQFPAHRIAYVLVGNIIPAGYQIDHLCRVRACVNPDHLEAVTQAENIRRGMGPSALNARKTRCKNSHEFTPENTYVRIDGGGRQCRTCHRLRRRRYAAEARA